jgi:hypothetical protein
MAVIPSFIYHGTANEKELCVQQKILSVAICMSHRFTQNDIKQKRLTNPHQPMLSANNRL